MREKKFDRVVSVCMSSEDIEKLEAIANETGHSVSSLIRSIVKEYLKKVEGGEEK